MSLAERRMVERSNEIIFSESSQAVLLIALEEARTCGRGHWIDTGDLLVGLSQIGTTAKKLNGAGVTIERIREVKRKIGGYDYIPRPATDSTQALQTLSQLPLTMRTHKIGVMLEGRAVESGRNIIEPEDMLATVLDESEGVGARVIRDIGVTKQSFIGDGI